MLFWNGNVSVPLFAVQNRLKRVSAKHQRSGLNARPSVGGQTSGLEQTQKVQKSQ